MKKKQILFSILFALFAISVLTGCYKIKYEITASGHLVGADDLTEPKAERIIYTDFNRDIQIIDVKIPWEKTVYILKAKDKGTPIKFSADFYYGDKNNYRGKIYSNTNAYFWTSDSISFSHLEDRIVNKFSTPTLFYLDDHL